MKGALDTIKFISSAALVMALGYFCAIGLGTSIGDIEDAPVSINDDDLGPIKSIKGEAKEWAGPISLYASSSHDVPPPGPMQGDIRTVVEFVAPEMIDAACAGGAPAAACAQPWRKRIIMPNPCAFAEDDGYAAIMCHEIGHLHGWDHPKQEIGNVEKYVAAWIGGGLSDAARAFWAYRDEVYALRREQRRRGGS